MSKSLLQTKKECLYCGSTLNLHRHHVCGGRNRQKSEEYGCWCWLCGKHHNLSDEGVHYNKEFDEELKDKCQRIFEEKYSNIEWMYHFGKDYKVERDYVWIDKEG